MPETRELQRARNLLSEDRGKEALPLLWELYDSKIPSVRLDAVLLLLATLDHVRENKKLIEVTGEGIRMAENLKRKDLCVYLLSRKSTFLLTELGFLIYKKRNLILSGSVFRWIDFSLEEDKKNFEAISKKCIQLEQEVHDLISEVLKFLESSDDHYLRGSIYMALGESYSSKYFNDQLDLMVGGRIRSKIVNFYIVRRWNFDKYINYDLEGRRQIKRSRVECIGFFEKAIEEFKEGGHSSDLARALYNLAVKLTLMFSFTKAQKVLKQSRKVAETNQQNLLVAQIIEFEKELKDKNKNTKNYVEDQGIES